MAILAILSGGLGIAVNAIRPNPVDWHFRSANSETRDHGKATIKPITLEEVRKHVGKAGGFIIDARPIGFYAMGHIPGALSLPRNEMDSDPANWQTRADHFLQMQHDERVVVYCSGVECTDSDAVALRLIANGWKNVLVFKGGWAAWKDNQLPMEKSDE